MDWEQLVKLLYKTTPYQWKVSLGQPEMKHDELALLAPGMVLSRTFVLSSEMTARSL